jgi:hypothetical protein
VTYVPRTHTGLTARLIMPRFGGLDCYEPCHQSAGSRMGIYGCHADGRPCRRRCDIAFEKPTTNSLQKLIERPRSPMKSAIGIYSTDPHPSWVAGNEASGMRGLDVGSRNAGRSALRPDQALPQQAAGYSRKSSEPRFTSRSSRMHLCRSGCAGAHPERSR